MTTFCAVIPRELDAVPKLQKCLATDDATFKSQIFLSCLQLLRGLDSCLLLLVPFLKSEHVPATSLPSGHLLQGLPG